MCSDLLFSERTMLLRLVATLALLSSVQCGRTNLAWEFCAPEPLLHGRESQAVITGLFPIRKSQDGFTTATGAETDGYLCGPVTEKGVELVEAVKWALDLLNKDYGSVFDKQVTTSFVPGVQIGIDVYDTCGNDQIAVQKTFNQFSDLYSSPSSCVFNQTQINFGVLGPHSRESSLEVGKFLGMYGHPTVSFAAMMTPEDQSSTVLSTVPSVDVIAEAMVATAKSFGWTQVALVYSDDAFGKSGRELTLKYAQKYDICVSNVERAPSKNLQKQQHTFISVLSRLLQNLPSAPAVLVFASKEASLELLRMYAATQPETGQAYLLNWIFADGFNLEEQELTLQIPTYAARGLFVVGPSAPLHLTEFNDRIAETNPRNRNGSKWLKELFQYQQGCRLPEEARLEYGSLPLCTNEFAASLSAPRSNAHLVAALDAVYGYAVALRSAWRQMCVGSPGLCPQLVQMKNQEFLQIMKNLEFDYEAAIRVPPSLYGRRVNFKSKLTSAGVFQLLDGDAGLKYLQVYNFHRGREIAKVAKPMFYNLDADGLMQKSLTIPKSHCFGDGKCFCVDTSLSPSYHYKPGTLTLAGVFPVHHIGTRLQACGPIRTGSKGYPLVEAFWYAINNLNGKEGPFAQILPGVILGGLAIDSCESPSKISYMLNGLLTGELDFTATKKGQSLNYLDVQGVVGGGFDNTSVEMATAMSYSWLPQITYGAETAVLNDATLYPGTLRTVLSDATRLTALLKLLEEMNWNYVQVLFSQSKFGKTMAQLFEMEAKTIDICVAQLLPLSADKTAELADTVVKLQSKPGANIVILFASAYDMRALLAGVKTAGLKKQFVFVAPKFWNMNEKFITDNIEEFAAGSITFSVPEWSNPSFVDYMLSRTFNENVDHQWFREFAEQVQNCQYNDTATLYVDKAKPSCDSSGVIVNLEKFARDADINRVINAVYSMAFGLHAVLQQYCGSQYSGVCSVFRSLNVKQRNAAIYSATKLIRFRDEANQLFQFSEQRDLDVPLIIYSFLKNESHGYNYIQTGTYAPGANGSTVLNKVGAEYYNIIESTCQDFITCAACQGNFSFLEQHISKPPSETTPLEFIVDQPMTDPGLPAASPLMSPETTDRIFLYTSAKSDVIIGGLFPIHKHSSSPFSCGNISEDGILMVESFLWAIETVNANPHLLKNINLGAFALDTCENSGETYSQLHKLFTAPEFYKTKAGVGISNADEIYAFINAPNDEVAVTASKIFTKYAVTSIGPDSPTDILNDNRAHPYSLRSSVPDKIQIEALFKILKRLEWNYVSVLYSQTEYGYSRLLRLKTEAVKNEVCISFSESIPNKNTAQSRDLLDQIVVKLKGAQNKGARAIILLLNDVETNFLLEAIDRAQENGLFGENDFTFMGMASWGNKLFPNSHIRKSGLGSIVLQYDAQSMDMFQTHLQGKTFGNNDRNPWWNEYYRNKFNCSGPETCLQQTHGMHVADVSPVIANIINSVFAFAVGLSNLQQQYCQQEGGFCEDLKQQENMREFIFQNTRSVVFSRGDDLNNTFEFGPEGWSPNDIIILNLVKNRNFVSAGMSPVAPRHIGFYAKNNLTMNIVPMGFFSEKPIPLKKLPSLCTNLSECMECSAILSNENQPLTTFKPSSSALFEQTKYNNTYLPTSTTYVPTTYVSIEPSTTYIPISTHRSKPVYAEDFIYVPPSTNGLILTAVFPLHNKGNNPFSCGELRPDYYQNLEAFLWALNQINSSPQILPGMKLGAVVLDSCFQSSRAVRDLANFLSGQVIFKGLNDIEINPNNTVGFVTSWLEKELLPLARVSDQFSITSISPGASASLREFKHAYPLNNLLYTSVSSQSWATSTVQLLQQIKWEAIALIYSDSLWGISGKEDMNIALKETDICLTFSKVLPAQSCSDPSVWPIFDSAVANLIAQKQTGIYGIVLWLEESTLVCLLDALERAIRLGTMKPGDFLFISASNLVDISHTLSGREATAAGMIHITSSLEALPGFEAYWKSLSADSTSINPWRNEMVSKVLSCQGIYSQTCNTIHNFKQNAHLIDTVNAVYSFAYGLDTVWKGVCGEKTEVCSELQQKHMLQKHLISTMRSQSFVDVASNLFKFGKDGFGNRGLELKSLVFGINGYYFNKFGTFAEELGLRIMALPQGFQNGVQSFSLSDRPSKCNDPKFCTSCFEKLYNKKLTDALSNKSNNARKNKQPDPVQESIKPMQAAELVVSSQRIMQDLLIIQSNHRFSLAGLFPIHSSLDDSGLICGPFSQSSGFQKLVAFLFALSQVNKDSHILPGLHLGAVALDTCSSEKRAIANMFEVFANDSPEDSPLSPTDILSITGMNYMDSINLQNMLNTLEIPQVSSVAVPMKWQQEELVMGTVPADDVYVRILADIVTQMEWTYFSILRETSAEYEATAAYFDEIIHTKGACVASTVSIVPQASGSEAQLAVRQLVLAAGAKTVVCFVSPKSIVKLMEALSIERVPAARFIFLTKYNEDWTYDMQFRAALSHFRQGLVTVEVQRHNNTEFLRFLSSMTLDNHDPIPTPWFQEFWQTHFQCILKNSDSNTKNRYNRECSGNEIIDPHTFYQSPTVLPTILAVQTTARGFQKFLQDNCPGRQVVSLEDCTLAEPRQKLMRAMKSLNFSYVYSADKDPLWVTYDRNGFMESDYSIRNLFRQLDGNFQYQEVGLWRTKTGLILDTSQVRVINSKGDVEVPKSRCLGSGCHTCPKNESAPLLSLAKPIIGQRFNSVWGVVIASIAGLGMIVCVLCIFYFIVSFPVNYGTTVCGYMILVGLFLVYALAFVYILSPSEIICGARRICTGVCWAFVFAPMLVKVAHTWHLSSSSDSLKGALSDMYQHTPKTSAFALFSLALGVASVQIVIAVEWVILQKPTSLVFVPDASQSLVGDWRCVPGLEFERMLIISLVYVMFLIALTTLFSLITWNADTHNKESRWIFVSCVFTVLIWAAWATIVTMTPYRIRDPAIAIAFVANATVILLCIYMRKAYLYQKYREEAKEYMTDTAAPTIYQQTALSNQFMNGSSNLYSKVVAMPPSGPVYMQSLPALPAPNGTLQSTHPNLGVEHSASAMVFQNAAYDGGSEFNPGAAYAATYGAGHNSSVVMVDPEGAMETSHRF